MLSGDNRKRGAYEEEECLLPEHVRIYGLRYLEDIARALFAFRELMERENRSDLDEQDVDFIEEELEEIGLALVEFPPTGWYLQLLTCGLCGEQISRPDIQEGNPTLRYAYCLSHSQEDIKGHEWLLLSQLSPKKATKTVTAAVKLRRKKRKSRQRFRIRRQAHQSRNG